jgi:hypothetical protein
MKKPESGSYKYIRLNFIKVDEENKDGDILDCITSVQIISLLDSDGDSFLYQLLTYCDDDIRLVNFEDASLDLIENNESEINNISEFEGIEKWVLGELINTAYSREEDDMERTIDELGGELVVGMEDDIASDYLGGYGFIVSIVENCEIQVSGEEIKIVSNNTIIKGVEEIQGLLDEDEVYTVIYKP